MGLNINKIINISVSSTGIGASSYNTSNIAMFTDESKPASFGTASFKIYTTPDEVGKDFGTTITFKMANAIFSQQPNILANRGSLIIIPFLNSETLAEAITRTSNLVEYFAILSADSVSETEGLAAAAIVQPLNKILGLTSGQPLDLDSGGYFDLLRARSFSKSRAFYFQGAADNEVEGFIALAAYFGRAFSTDFSGSATTSTMNLKTLNGIQPDSTITDTVFEKAKTVGADLYTSFGGSARTISFGANQFFDYVYNLEWFLGALEISGFNTLALAGNKITQTETGLDLLKGSYKRICEQSIINQYISAGAWTLPTTFGNQEDFFNNIKERGYYIYSAPISQQLPSKREAREAPLVQVAIKLAGAIHNSSILININK